MTPTIPTNPVSTWGNLSRGRGVVGALAACDERKEWHITMSLTSPSRAVLIFDKGSPVGSGGEIE